MELPKTAEGLPPPEDYDLLYNSKCEMEELQELSPPSSQLEQCHKTTNKQTKRTACQKNLVNDKAQNANTWTQFH